MMRSNIGSSLRRKLRCGRVQPVKVDEDLLGDVFGLVRIGQHAVGNAGDPRVFSFEQRLESLFASFHESFWSLSGGLDVESHY